VKSHSGGLEGAAGLRLGIYPQQNASDGPRKDDDLNLIRLPLPYDSAFCELFYKSFFLFRAFLNADAKVPAPVNLPDAEDRLVTKELQSRRDFPVTDVLGAIRDMSQQSLVATERFSPSITWFRAWSSSLPTEYLARRRDVLGCTFLAMRFARSLPLKLIQMPSSRCERTSSRSSSRDISSGGLESPSLIAN